MIDEMPIQWRLNARLKNIQQSAAVETNPRRRRLLRNKYHEMRRLMLLLEIA